MGFRKLVVIITVLVLQNTLESLPISSRVEPGVEYCGYHLSEAQQFGRALQIVPVVQFIPKIVTLTSIVLVPQCTNVQSSHVHARLMLVFIPRVPSTLN